MTQLRTRLAESSAKNAAYLGLIESSICSLVLDDAAPADDVEFYKMLTYSASRPTVNGHYSGSGLDGQGPPPPLGPTPFSLLALFLPFLRTSQVFRRLPRRRLRRQESYLPLAY